MIKKRVLADACQFNSCHARQPSQTCCKQYTTAMELQAHLSSYDHHHRKRLAEMRVVEAERTRGVREKKERRNAEREAARLEDQCVLHDGLGRRRVSVLARQARTARPLPPDPHSSTGFAGHGRPVGPQPWRSLRAHHHPTKSRHHCLPTCRHHSCPPCRRWPRPELAAQSRLPSLRRQGRHSLHHRPLRPSCLRLGVALGRPGAESWLGGVAAASCRPPSPRLRPTLPTTTRVAAWSERRWRRGRDAALAPQDALHSPASLAISPLTQPTPWPPPPAPVRARTRARRPPHSSPAPPRPPPSSLALPTPFPHLAATVARPPPSSTPHAAPTGGHDCTSRLARYSRCRGVEPRHNSPQLPPPPTLSPPPPTSRHHGCHHVLHLCGHPPAHRPPRGRPRPLRRGARQRAVQGQDRPRQGHQGQQGERGPASGWRGSLGVPVEGHWWGQAAGGVGGAGRRPGFATSGVGGSSNARRWRAASRPPHRPPVPRSGGGNHYARLHGGVWWRAGGHGRGRRLNGRRGLRARGGAPGAAMLPTPRPPPAPHPSGTGGGDGFGQGRLLTRAGGPPAGRSVVGGQRAPTPAGPRHRRRRLCALPPPLPTPARPDRRQGHQGHPVPRRSGRQERQDRVPGLHQGGCLAWVGERGIRPHAPTSNAHALPTATPPAPPHRHPRLPTTNPALKF